MKEVERVQIERIIDQLSSKRPRDRQPRVESGVGLTSEELEAIARDELNGLVNTWANEFVSSELYNRIYSSLKSEPAFSGEPLYRVYLTQSIVTPWNGRLFETHLEIKGDRYGQRFKEPTCTVGRDPLIGMGWAAAMGRKSREGRFALSKPEQLLEDNHPIFVIELANQIRNGDVWDRLRGSLHRVRLAVATDQEMEEFHRDRFRQRDKFVAKWGNRLG